MLHYLGIKLYLYLSDGHVRSAATVIPIIRMENYITERLKDIPKVTNQITDKV